MAGKEEAASAAGRQAASETGSHPDVVTSHLRRWLGAWPPAVPLQVVAHAERDVPGWDGRVRPLIGVGRADGIVLSVTPRAAAAVEDLLAEVGGLAPLTGDDRLGALVGRPGHRPGRGVFRVARRVPPLEVLPDAGVWLARSDPRIPTWLQPFNGGILGAFGDDGRFDAGVGVKRHDALGRELAVVTEPHARGRGLARRLVAQAARRFLAEQRAVTYLHDPDNTASARVAEAAGFPDDGWSVYGLFAEG